MCGKCPQFSFHKTACWTWAQFAFWSGGPGELGWYHRRQLAYAAYPRPPSTPGPTYQGCSRGGRASGCPGDAVSHLQYPCWSWTPWVREGGYWVNSGEDCFLFDAHCQCSLGWFTPSNRLNFRYVRSQGSDSILRQVFSSTQSQWRQSVKLFFVSGLLSPVFFLFLSVYTFKPITLN